MTKEDLKYRVMDIFSVVVSDYLNSNVYLYSTQAAFFLIISAVPFLMFLLSLLKFLFPLQNSELLPMIEASIPNSLDYFVGKIIQQVYSQSSLSLTSVSAITTLWAASKSNHALSQGLNQIYKTGRVRNVIQLRISSILNTITLMITMLMCLIVLVFGNSIAPLLDSSFPQLHFFSEIVDFKAVISIVVLTAIIALLYTVLPDKILKFRHQLPGAFCTTIIWLVFSWVYSLYVNNVAKFSITYGMLATLVLTMMWLQICMNIFLMCAQLNVYIYEIRHGFQDHDH